MVRQHESKRANDVRGDLPEDFALDQRLADQPELVIFQITQAAMHEFRRPGRRTAGQIVHFTQENRVTAPSRVARDTTTVDAAPNDCEVENPIQRRFPGVRLFTLAILLSIWNKSQPNAKASENGEPGVSMLSSSAKRTIQYFATSRCRLTGGDYWMPAFVGMTN